MRNCYVGVMRHDLPSKLTIEDLDIVLIDETLLLEAL